MTERTSCPFLGIETDVQTRSACEAIPNYCHRVRLPRPVKDEYQHAVCNKSAQLSHPASQILDPQPVFTTCPLYAANARLTRAELSQILKDGRNYQRQSAELRLVLTGLVVVLVIGVIYFELMGGGIGSISKIYAQAPSPLSMLALPTKRVTSAAQGGQVTTITPSATTFRLPSKTPTGAITSVGNPTPTAAGTLVTISPGPFVETPFGPASGGATLPTGAQGLKTPSNDQEATKLIFLIHHVSSGEDLYGIARKYHTTIDVICAVNGRKPGDTRIITGTDLVILPNRTDVKGVIPLRPVYIGGLSKIANIAIQYGVDGDQIRAMNDISGDTVVGPRWIVVELK